MDNPSKIIEGGVEYSLGKFDGKSVLYDFPKILIYLNAKGKLLFGKKFRIYDEDKGILLKLCSYFIKDKDNCEKFEIDIEKGILLSGPVGCGKTSLMKLLRHIVPLQRPYEMIPCRNVTFSFNHLGFKTVEEYGNTKFYCFDDLGVEPAGRFYGKGLNVMGEVLLSRYELYLDTKRKIKTHATTNLNAEELEERYGNRVRSRMRELFNLIAFDTKAVDKRK
ncbi:ATPase [Muricauda oceani]|jgi:energy-coupling factor transporter ATP-binding protein EcfA2|uniref:ATPase n=1 Tax=Flagellimonas oceani TaxID=2698672 RepID=A0A6G7J7P5_9FLAO|nr:MULTISPECIES: ATPase [Allomuricauda]MAM17363.1 ATPase [Christiangramia sp.]MBW8241982.1 ATPase [Allomuricauda oceani]QII46893.1 ATPase [Allomuricauda oceani]|tara:strand:- start:2142 stop:2804 length:663 start_codon:yes stop_codon:yes gene_type:complete